MGNKVMSTRAFVDEKYTRPQGVYDPKDGDYRKLRRLILNGQLAPCFPGAEECTSELDECPICFLFYPSLNRSRCCSKSICTECYLQIKSARFARSTQCPYCKTLSYTVEFRGAKTSEEKGVEQAEEQKVIEAKIRIRQKELHDDAERVRRLGEDAQAGQSEEPFEHETNHMLMEPSMSAQAAEVQGSVHRLTKNDGFDLDIEDMMLMEAMWLSIQEQGQMHQEFALAQQSPALRALSERGFLDSNEISTQIAGRPGGLTRAITALADQVVNSSQNLIGSDRSLNENHNDMPSCEFRDLSTRSCTIDPLRRNLGANRDLQKEKQDVSREKRQDGEQSWQTASCGSEELNGWLNVSKGNSFWSSVQREGRDVTFDLGLNQSSSEVVEAGTSFSSSIPSASELPWEAPEFHSSRSSDNVGETSLSTASASMLPVSFEDQIMLAMALSLADAQAQARRQ